MKKKTIKAWVIMDKKKDKILSDVFYTKKRAAEQLSFFAWYGQVENQIKDITQHLHIVPVEISYQLNTKHGTSN